MKLVDKIKVDKLPDSCRVCCFNLTKYCSALMVTEGYKTTFVQNNIDKRDEFCPLIADNNRRLAK